MYDFFDIINNKFGVSVVTRYFRNNEGTTDYATLDSPVPLTADFDIDLILQRNTASNTAFLGGDNSTRAFQLTSNGIEFSNVTGGVLFANALTGIANGSLFSCKIKRVSGVLTATVLGVDYPGNVTNAGTYSISVLLANQVMGSNTVGVMADLRISAAGPPIHFWPINDNGNTFADSIGGNNATLVNPDPDDWGFFTEQPALWKGQDLVVPPWASVDQELLKA